ncbi:MAG TPA: universal stress protein [Usitatibacter sp.]|jgi:nucleotide-binding universal stress UspA family protein|nr:universal stress protein [Usitatibacter sp.]
MYKRILLAYDGSESGQRALLESRELADWGKSNLHMIAVMPPPAAFIGGEGGVYDLGLEEQERKEYQAILDDGLKRLRDAGHSATGELVVGEAVAEIVSCAKRLEADLIVVGHKHLDSWAARWWRGSVSKSLIEHASCNVLVVITK